MINPSADHKGFTLLEVAIAVTLISILFLALFRMQSGTIRLAESGRFANLTPALAATLLAQVEINVSEFGDTEGDFGEAYPGAEWTCEISDFEIEADALSGDQETRLLKRIDVSITSSGSSGALKFTTWRIAE